MERIILTPQNTDNALDRAVQVLLEGGLVIYPTETMYGAGADATNPEAVSRMLAFKNRPAGKAVSVMVPGMATAEAVVELNAAARQLYAAFLPGPVTVVSRSLGTVDKRLESEFGTLGIRISSHPLAPELCARLGRPITSTSANASGAARPYSIDIALKGLSESQRVLIGLILDAGPLPRREPSTVIDTTQEVQEVVRGGANLTSLAKPVMTASAEETTAYARRLMASLLHVLPERPVIFALEGEMGAGKTHFAKGVAESLGVAETVTSPTYVLMKEYEGRAGRLVHIDLWRLTGFNPEELGLVEYLRPGTVLVVEWAAEALEYLKAHDALGLYVRLDSTGETERRLSLHEL